MFKRLHRRLTIVCSLVTGIILLGMAGASLYLSVQQLQQRSQMEFPSSLNAILFHLTGQRVIDTTWMSQMEASGRLILHIENNGIPLLYRGAQDTALRAHLLQGARQAALEHGFDLSEPSDNRLLTSSMQFPYTDPATGQQYYAAAATIPSGNSWLGVLLLKSKRPDQDQIAYLCWMFAFLTVLACGLLFIFAWIFTRRAIRPIEESRRRQTEFISAASHELRSPLAVIRASLSAMRTAPPERAIRFADSVDNECQRMSRLITDMLTLANADSGTWSVTREETDMETLLLDISEGFEAVAQQHGIRLTVDLPDDPLPHCWCDANRMAQVLTVLVDNALSYTAAGGFVVLSAQACRMGIRLLVRDNGPGVPDAEKEQIFQRFYRADPSRSKKDHYGLGLCIAHEIVTLHRGKISVLDASGGGACFQVDLPCGP